MQRVSARESVRRARSLVLAAACATCATACRAPSDEREPEARYPWIGAERGETAAWPSREWLAFSLGWLARDEDPADPVGDGLALGIDGGFDLAHTRLTPSIELGLGYANARVEAPGESNVDLWRATAGLRATWHGSGWRPWVRGGGFVRWASDEREEPFDPYATGVYAGFGIDWPYLPGMRLGPRVTWYRALDEQAPGGEAEEWLFALSATFRL